VAFGERQVSMNLGNEELDCRFDAGALHRALRISWTHYRSAVARCRAEPG
jgi:hypothetical protein